MAYAVMGELAVRVHALPRPTQDVDLIISINQGDLSDWYKQLEEAGITVPAIYKDGWIDQVAQMPLIKFKIFLDTKHGVDLDVFLAVSSFQTSVLARRVTAEFEGKKFDIVSPEDLVLLKLIANRPRDLIDVQDVLFIQGELDNRYLRHWAEQLGITDRLEKVLAA